VPGRDGMELDRQKEDSVLYEWHAKEVCWPEQHEVARIIYGDTVSSFFITPRKCMN
jgi:hypothetical protein